MKMQIWKLQSMIALAHSAGAENDWIIDFASEEAGKGFLLTSPKRYIKQPDDLVPELVPMAA